MFVLIDHKKRDKVQLSNIIKGRNHAYHEDIKNKIKLFWMISYQYNLKF